jgi:hypothetical protein
MTNELTDCRHIRTNGHAFEPAQTTYFEVLNLKHLNMASGSDSWGGDYSFLLQSIEGRISENIVNKTPSAVNRTALDESASKRRWSDFQSPANDISMSSAKKLKSFAEIDELMIVNEQLRDNVARLESEREIAKQEHLRQLKFLDDRCTALKKESADRLEKYYEEKKKWQSKHRELEQQVKKLSSAPQAAAPQSSNVTSNSLNSARNEEITQRLQLLERELTTKITESRENLKGRLDAESKLFEYETELRSLRSSVGEGSLTEEARLEARTLRKQLAELESVHKRTAREHDGMKSKLKNQTLLEEEVSTLKAKLRLTEEKLNTFKQEQLDYQLMLEERNVWTQLFQDIVTQPEHSELMDESALTGRAAGAVGTSGNGSGASAAGNGGAAVSPTVVLHLLSAYQSRCAVLLQGQGQLQQSLSELRRQAREAQMQHLDSDAALQSTQARLETVEQQLRTALQQGRLYDGEIRSLRSLLETYDLEFRIGKPDADKMMSLKDRLIAELRAELDAARQSASALATHVKSLEAAVEGGRTVVLALQEELQQVRDELSQAQTQAASLSSSAGRDSPVTATAFSADAHSSQEDLEHEVTALRTQVETAQHDLQYLQYVTGLDYFPDRTRVLHLADNPTSHAPAVVTLPSVTELRRQRTDLKKQLNAAQAEALQAQHEAATSAANAVTSTVPAPAPTPAPAPIVVSAPQLEIVNQRLKEQFKEKIAAFREAVYLIFGFKVGACLCAQLLRSHSITHQTCLTCVVEPYQPG